jgi:hypothetical protein
MSYDQVEVSLRAERNLYDRLDAYLNNVEGAALPKCPLLALRSHFWKLNGVPIKRLILDEAQMINKMGNLRHPAVKSLSLSW